jgi:tetratricopeptide (TPR) repeat protein
VIGASERLPFVGRQHELATLRAHLAAAAEGRGGVLFVAGEPGIGKTRLLLEIGHLARAQGWEVRRRLPDLPDSPIAGTEVDRYRLFEGLTEFLLAIARALPSRGLLLVLDDLHWADKSSLLLLQHLAHRLAEARLLVAGSYRTVELHRTHPLATVLADLRRDGISERLLLPPLPPEAVVVLAEALAGVRPAAGVLDLIARQTDGNPFFVRELTLHLQAEGFLQGHGATTTATWSVPESVREVIGRRLAKLGPQANQVLQAAAVLGGGFSFEVLRAMSGIEDALLLDAIDETAAAGILREEGEGYAFGHALIRETLYSELSLARRQRLHLRAAEVLMAVHADTLAGYLSDIADHYRLAGPVAEPAKAIDSALRAGEAAAGVFASEQALSHWRTALRLMERRATGPDQRLSLLERLAELTRSIGFDHYPQAISYWSEALQLCEANGLVERAAQARCGLGRMLASNAATMDIPAAVTHLRAAQAVLEQQPGAASLGLLYGGLATAASWGARTQEGLEASHRELELGARLGDEALSAHGAVLQGWHLIAAGRLGDGLAFMQRAWETGDRLDRTFAAYVATSWRGNRYFLLGDLRAAAACYEQELAKTRLAAAPTRRLALISSLAAVRARIGDLVEARQLLDRLGPHTFDQDSAMLAQPLLDFWSGDWESASAAWAAARERHHRAGNRWGVADFGCWLAQLRHLQGDPPGAVRAFEEALAIAVEAPIVPMEVKARTGLALLAADVGDHLAMQSHIARCVQILARGEDWRGLAGAVALSEAIAMATRGVGESAEEKFAEAIQIFHRYTLPWDEGQALHWWGVRLRVLAGKGRRTRSWMRQWRFTSAMVPVLSGSQEL